MMSGFKTIHVLDENVGPDASVARIPGGKKKGEMNYENDKGTFPLPVGGKFGQHEDHIRPSRSELGVKGPNLDHAMWRVYRTTISAGDSSRGTGKKMTHGSLARPMHEFAAAHRQAMRRNLKAAYDYISVVQQENTRELNRFDRTIQLRRQLDDETMRRRCKAKGFEGLTRPSLRSTPDYLPEAAGVPPPANWTGKRMIKTQHGESAPPFGGRRVASAPMQRWDVKCLD